MFLGKVRNFPSFMGIGNESFPLEMDPFFHSMRSDDYSVEYRKKFR
jgi:hypothetical protein